MGWQWHQLDYMQIICTSLQTGNNISSSSLDFLQAECSFRRPTNSVRALKAVSALKAKYSNQHKNYPTQDQGLNTDWQFCVSDSYRSATQTSAAATMSPIFISYIIITTSSLFTSIFTFLWTNILFCSCSFPLSSFFLFFSSPILSCRRLDVYHTSAHDMALVRI